jgi:hypothetical protein
MNGYVKNVSNIWTHAMKRAIGPGKEVPLDELYEQYGKKHDLSEGEEFVNWLKNVKLRDTNKWKIVVETDESKSKGSKEEAKQPEVDDNRPMSNVERRNLEIEEVVNLSVRKAREVIPSVTDLKLLKYALQEANQRAGKDSLCRILRKRIRELQLTR